LKIALIISAIFLLNYQLFGQGNVLELLPGAESSEFNKKTGVLTLIGGAAGVNFRYQGNTMYCDSAHFWSISNEVRAYGNVHITKEDLNLYCDSLYYNGKTKFAKLWGNVRVRDQEYKIITDTLDYDAKKSVAIYRYGGRIENILKKETLTSKVGFMYPNTKNFLFSGRVVYAGADLKMTTDTLKYNYSKSITSFFGPTNIIKTDPETKKITKIYCERGWFNTETEEGNLKKKATITNGKNVMSGEDLYSYSKKGLAIGKGNVIYKDTTQKIEFRGNYAYSNDDKNIAFLTGKAVVLKMDGKDTLFIHADTLFSYKDSLGNSTRLKGYNNVKFFRHDMQGKCDSLLYDKVSGKMEMHTSPILWVKEKVELKGDYIEVLFSSDSIVERANVVGNSTVLIEVDSGKYYHQIGGKDINAFFEKNDLYRTDVMGNARTVFFPEDKSSTDTTIVIKRLGMNRIYASDLKIYIDSNEVDGITYLDKPDGVFYPMDQIKKEEQFIQGFKWQAALRPKKWLEIFE
jgi:lipopolysaccharide export system protein LptA